MSTENNTKRKPRRELTRRGFKDYLPEYDYPEYNLFFYT